MIGLDTPVLLEILGGRPSAKALLKRLTGEEVGTTELNLFELAAVARALGPAGLERRLAAIDRLRRGLTVIPLDAHASRLASSRWRGDGQGLSSTPWLLLGALEANGCTEWVTSRALGFPKTPSKLHVTRILT
ncbi:MAG: PIN domain-containing protein [Thermoplasmata archaeon]|nr:PIN domain-containing protein [Thermoplasmata archaeon]